MKSRYDSRLIDPDPFMIASLALGAVSAVFGAVQSYKAIWPSPAPATKANHRPHQLEQLGHLESHIERLTAAVNRLSRAIERHASDAEAQFYDAPLRIGHTSLLVSEVGLKELAAGYSEGALEVAGIFRWLTIIQTTNPDLAYRLGESLNEPLSRVTERINDALARGAPIRIVLAELRATLGALAQAIEVEIGRSGN